MKKSISLLMIISIALSMLIFPVTSAAYTMGDVDRDGKIAAADARITLRHSVQLQRITGPQLTAADMDNDGNITAGDARSILRMSVGFCDTASVTAIYADSYNGNYSSFETIYASDNTSYRFPVIVSTNMDVTDFRIVGLKYSYVQGDDFYYKANTIKNLGTLRVGEKIVVYVTCLSDLYYEFGIAYKDVDGKEKVYGFFIHGYDGSLVLCDACISSYSDASVTGTAKVTASYGNKTDYFPMANTVFASISSFAHPVIVKTDKRIEDFTVLGMDKDASTGKIITNVIKNCGTVAAGNTVNIFVTFNTEKPVYGFSYKDSDGVEKVFSIKRSTKDSSLIITREYNTVKKTPEKVTLQATFGDNVSYSYSHFYTHFVSKSAYSYPVILTTNVPVKNLRIVGISWIDNPKVYKYKSTYNCGTLIPGEPIIVYVHMPEWTPIYAVAYEDSDGKERVFTITCPVNGAGDKVYYALGNEITLIR